MRWLRATMGVVTAFGGLYFGHRAVDWVAGHDYVLALASTFACVSSFRACASFFATEVAE